MIAVYQVPSKLFAEACRCFDEARLKAFFDKHFTEYEPVAEVEGECLDKAFQLTNTIHQAWWENDGVTVKFEAEGCRSTSVGDLMIRGEESFLVAGCGFLQIK